jgi:membrane-associated phospholipid phosphatase
MAIGHFTGLAFPSGHATLSAAVYGMGAVLISRATNRPAVKVAAWVGAVVIIVLVGVTRLYLGAHWLSDVLAGWALGALWLGAVLRVSGRWPASRSGSSSPSAGPGPGPELDAASVP